MKKNLFKRILTFIFTCIIMLCDLQYIASAEPQLATKLDIVFVLDASISMKNSDPQDLRYEAIKLYMDMCSDDGNRIGIVAYGGELAGEKALTEISSSDSKTEIISYLNTLKLIRYTDTGIGLQKGLEILEDSDSDDGAKKAIILLSDGKNEPKRELSQCNSDTNAVLEHAKKKGYPIYTIGLNADGTVDSKLLNNLASGTGGKSYITSEASELNTILQEIYTANTTSKIIDTGNAEGDKNITADISIPNSSVQEAIITVFHKNPVSIELSDPLGSAVTIPSDNVVLSQSATYSIIKLINPSEGTWNLKATSSTTEKLTVNYVLIYRLKAALEIDATEGLKRGDSVEISLYLTNNGEKIADTEEYKDLSAHGLIYSEDGTLIKKLPLVLNEGGTCFKGSHCIETTGSYRIEGEIQGDIFYSAAEPVSITLANNAPSYIGDINKVKLFIGKEKVLDLNELFGDPDATPLTYTAETDANGVSVQITGSNLMLKADSKLKGTLTITADDANGGIATKELEIVCAKTSIFTEAIEYLRSLTPEQVIMVVVPLAVAIIALVLLIILIKKKKKVAIMRGGIILKGQIMLNVVDNNTGEVFPPQFLKLKNYTKGVTIFTLLSYLPEYSETSGIKLFTLDYDVISIKNDTECLIKKNGIPSKNNKYLEVSPNDVIEIRLEKLNRSIRIKYLP